MKCFFLIVCIGLSVEAFDKEEFKKDIFEYRIDSQHLYLEHLKEAVEKLEDLYEHLEPMPSAEDVAELKARLRKLEPSLCKKDHYPCGDDHYHCTNELMFCDGHADCPNKADENEKTCNGEIVNVGRSYHGLVTWHSCENHEPHDLVITIVSKANHNESAHSRVLVKAVISLDIHGKQDDLNAYSAKGYFSFGRRAFVLSTDDEANSHFAIVCTFDLGNEETAHCQIKEKTSKKLCATFVAEKS